MPKYYLYRSCYLGDKYLWNNFYRVIRLSNLIMSVDLEHHKISMGVKYFLLKKLTPLQLGLWVPLNYVTFIQGWGLNTCLLSAYPFVCNIKIICRVRVDQFIFIQGRCLHQHCEIIVWQYRIYLTIHHWLTEHC